MSRLRVLAASVGALLVLGAAAGCSDEVGSSGDQGFVSGQGIITALPASERSAPGEVAGRTIDGEPLSLADYEGQVVVVNVWGSWCAPCRAEAPNLAEVAKDTEDKGVRFVGINTRDLDRANAKAFERNFGIEYPSFYDPSGKLILRFPKGSLSPQAIPSTLILDRDGKIAVRALKELGEKELRHALDPLTAEK
jgi:thiol-disulfide isomerase/thioredoxin